MSFLGSRKKGDSGCDKWSFSKSSTSPRAPWTEFHRKWRLWRLFLGNGGGAGGGWRVTAGSPAAHYSSTCLWEALMQSPCGLGAQQFTLRLKNSSASTLPFTFPNTDLKAEISSTNTGRLALTNIRFSSSKIWQIISGSSPLSNGFWGDSLGLCTCMWDSLQLLTSAAELWIKSLPV